MKTPLSRRLKSLVAIAVFLSQALVKFAAGAPPPLPATGVPQLLNYQGRVTVAGQNFDGTGQFKFALVDGGANHSVTATASCVVDVTGRLEKFEVHNRGRGYQTPPRVTIEGTGTGAEGTAVLDGDEVVSITLTKTGSDYSTVTPTTVTIAPPPVNLVPVTYWTNDGTGVDGQEPQQGVSCLVTKGLYSVLLGDAGMAPLTPQVFSHPDVRLRVWFSPTDRDPVFTQLAPDQRIAAVGYALMAEDVKDGSITSAKLASNSITLAQLSPELRQTIQGLQAWQATQVPVITSAATASATVEGLFTYQITATGSPTSWNATNLPPGWSVNPATGLVSGTPAAAGTVTLSVSAGNSAGFSIPMLVSVNVTGPVFVDYAIGSDGNDGTQAAPVKTVSQGIAIARASPVLRSVRVSSAAQSFSSPLRLKGGVDVRGGYDRGTGWTRTAPRTPLIYVPHPGAGPVAVLVESVDTPVLLDGFAITCPNATIPGDSPVGVGVVTCYQQLVRISNNTISAGNGANGAAPTQHGTHGVAGAAGWNAVSWRGPQYPASAAYSPNYSPLWDYPGCGGIPDQQVVWLDDFGSNTHAFPAYAGWPGKVHFTSNYQLVLGAAGGAGGNSVTPPGNGAHGTPGGNGQNGSNYWFPASPLRFYGLSLIGNGSNGTPGTRGGDGGNGGGGGSIFGSASNTALWGGGGGGGGKAGTGGGAGGGGKAAGGSFGILVVSSTATVTGCSITTGNGGTGGAGGNGGNPGPGGNGGAGFVTPAVGINNPGDGGWGGAGGDGGAGTGGAGGNGGPSIGIAIGTGAVLTQSGNTFSPGTGGAGGTGGLRGGSLTVRAPSGLAGMRANTATEVAP